MMANTNRNIHILNIVEKVTVQTTIVLVLRVGESLGRANGLGGLKVFLSLDGSGLEECTVIMGDEPTLLFAAPGESWRTTCGLDPDGGPFKMVAGGIREPCP